MASSPRVMEVTTPLGPGVLLFYALHAREELGRVGELRLELLSEKADIAIDDILGKSITVKLSLQDDSLRFFNGYVTRFSQGGLFGKYKRYYATVNTWPWFMSRTSDCRIFQDMSVPDIVKKVFSDHTVAKFKDSLTQSYPTWKYCVQYRETDLNFVCRLLEEEGIYFFFTHDEGEHTLVLADSYSAHEQCQADPIPFMHAADVARDDIEHISSWTLSREVQPGAYVQDDYDFERPSVELRTKKLVTRQHAVNDYEIYDYPGGYVLKPDGEALAAVRIDEYAAQFETAQGAGNVKSIAVGSLFTLARALRPDQNREHLVVSATYDFEYSSYEAMSNEAGAEYRCGFIAMASNQQFRPARLTPKPFVQGPQTAVVVGPSGDEIYTDQYGRVKVLFHWDREGEKKKDENSSCWVRVSQPWAGKAWGAVAIPRIGQEVIVDFLEGDPDQPIITGRVYNAEQMPPYALPANMTQTGIKSRSSKGGGPDNFNEIRFEDKKGEEQLFIHAEKNQDIEVEHDETHWVGHDRAKTIDHDEITHVKHNRTETVDNDETITISGNRTESVAKDESITISKNRTESVGENESISIGKDRTVAVGKNQTLNVAKVQSTSVGDSRSLDVAKDETINIGKNQSLSVAESRTTSVGKDDTISIGKKLTIDVGDQITIQTGSASIVMKKDGTITIKGKDITLQGSGKINVKAASDVIVKGSKIAEN